MEKILQRCWSLFNGLDRVHGKYAIDKSIVSDKNKVSGAAQTLEKPVTTDLWEKHVRGRTGLGIVPIRDDQNCVFAALDIDVYDLDLKALNQQTQELQLPFVLTRTKSGGAHLYIFFKEPVPAEYVITRLKEMAAAIGYPSVEVFPKQKYLGPQDHGNWINMPYFGCWDGEKYTAHDRYGLDDSGKALTTLEAYLDHCESKKISLAAFKALEVRPLDRPLIDGPPCLQRLLEKTGKFNEGARNNCLFQLGVYLKQKYADNDEWKDKMEEFNFQYFDPPLRSNEVQQTLRQVAKDQNFYRCKIEPFESHCSREVCLTRKFGIGGNGGEDGEFELMLGPLKKTETMFGEEIIDDEATWYWTIDGIEMTFSTSEIASMEAVRRRIMNRLKRYPAKIRPARWDALVKEKVESAQIIIKDFEESKYADLFLSLRDFLELRRGADNRVEILDGRVWQEDGWYWFKTTEFNKWLTTRGVMVKVSTDKRIVFDIMRNHFGAETKQLSMPDMNPQYCWRVPVSVLEDTVVSGTKPAPREF